MSNHTTTIDSKTVKALFDEIEFYRRGLSNLRKKLLRSLPEKLFSYGGELWWEKSEIEADEDIKRGNISRKYTNMKRLTEDLDKGVLRKS